MKYALTTGLTLTATINPDFGQVEADPAVVNLTAFETFFNERRPFFVEGSGNFNFGLDCSDGACTGLFYSRRIGRTPQGNEDLPTDDGIYTDAPSQTAILGAAKLTGRVGQYSVGVLQAFTRREAASIWQSGVVSQQLVEPATSYSLGRVRREFANQSSIGFMLTSTNRQQTPDTAVPRADREHGGHGLGPALQDQVRDPGLSGRQQHRRRSGSDRAAAGKQPALFSASRSDERHVRSDPHVAERGRRADRRRPRSAANSSGSTSTASFKSPGFDINDVGFLRRADQRNSNNWLQFRSDRPNRVFRSRMINFNMWRAWNYDGDRLWGGENINAHATFVNNWQIGGGYNWRHTGLDDRETRGGPGGPDEPGHGIWYCVNTDHAPSRCRSTISAPWAATAYGTSWREFSPEVTYRPDAQAVDDDWRSIQPIGRRLAVGQSDHRHVEPLRLRTPRSDDRRAHRRG